MVERVGDGYQLRLRLGVAQHGNGRWAVVAELDGQSYQSPDLFDTEADAVAHKDRLRSQILDGLAGTDDLRVEHRVVNDEWGKRQ
jgi:hypothetical protein